MSHIKIRACSIILKDHFGSVVQSVGECLLKVSWRSLGEIARSTNLPLAKIKKSLMVLIHQNLVDFEAHPRGTVKYSINADRVLCMLRYSRYIYCTKMLYGDAGEFIIEEVLLNGRLCMSLVLQKVLERLQGAGTAEDVKQKFVDLVKTSFLCRVPYPDPDAPASKIPSLIMPDDVMYKIPEVKLYLLKQNTGEPSAEPPAKKIKMEKPDGEKQPDEKEYWRVNIDRFHQHLRDQLVVQAVSKRMGAKAGEVVRTMLRLSETRSHPKDAYSAPVSRSEIYQSLQQEIKISQQELDSYLSLLADDALGLVRRTDERGGMFSVNLERTLRLLAEGVLASIVQDRFGAKSCRIFRLLLEKKYLEQKQIEELAMITARDAKEMTYKMFQEKFVLAQELPRTPDYAPSRMIYLFHVDIPQLSRQVLEWCYKALANMMLRRIHITQDLKRLLDKKQRVDLILSTMHPNNSTPEQIAEVKEMVTPPERKQLAYVRHVTSKIGLGEVQLDETILILQLYILSLSK
nr:DNA-directed RNA polymerase III subunit RPC3-like [Dermacentor andersoni]